MTLARRLGLHSLQSRFLFGTVLVLLLVMVAVVLVVEHRQRDAIVAEVQRRGEVMVRSLAAVSAGPLLLYNYTALEQNVARMAGEADVVSVILLDAEGKVAAHSHHPERVGTRLEGVADRGAAGASALFIQETLSPNSSEGIYDFALPIQVGGQKWGTARIALSKRGMEAEIRRTRIELGLLTLATLLLGGGVAALIARRIARPVRELAEGARAVARGDLVQQIAPSGWEELGQLAVTFNHMASQLLQERSALETAHVELRQRFEELADLKSYTDSILGSLTSGVVTVGLDGRITTLNPAAELLTGLFAGEAVGRFSTEAFAHAPGVAEALMETLATRSGIMVTLTLGRPNGTAGPVELSTAPLRGDEGKELGVVAVLRDLAQVRELEEQLRRSDRLAALGTLAAGLAHEIKNPLTSVRTFARLVGRKFEDARFRESFQRVVPRELDRINTIVEQLLELARPARLSLEPVRVPRLLEGALELYAHQIETRRIVVIREYARDCPVVQADPDLLHQAFVNLVGNALDAMSPGGQLTLRAGRADDGLPAARGPGQAAALQVEIEDTGAGIPSVAAEKVFNPFFTTKPGGTGLGLALAHRAIEDHGGTIGFRSTPGAGTTFRVLLPLAVEAPRRRADA